MYNPHDYDGETMESRMEEERELDLAAERAHEEALDLERFEAAEGDRLEELEREALICSDAVWSSVASWRAAVTPQRYGVIGNGLFVRVGSPKKSRKVA